MVFNLKRQQFANFCQRMMNSIAYAITTASETLATGTYKYCLCKTGDFAGKFVQLV